MTAENGAETEERRWSSKVSMILGDAVNPYHHCFERLAAISRKFELHGLEFPTVEVVEFFEGDGNGAGRDKQAADRRACAVAWSMERFGELAGWLVDAGVTIDDARPGDGANAPA